MDFGFASLLDKFEEHYGRRAGKVLVGLIALAVVVVCLGLIWGFIAPIVAWINGSVEDQSIWAFIARGIGFVIGLFFLMACAAGFSTVLEARNLMRLSASIVDDAHQTTQQAEEFLLLSQRIMTELDAKLGGDGSAGSEFDPLIQYVKTAREDLRRTSGKMQKLTKN